jgi:hypothetical protein
MMNGVRPMGKSLSLYKRAGRAYIDGPVTNWPSEVRMTARFRQVKDMGGVDEGAGPLDAGIVVPASGSSPVFLESGQGFALQYNHHTITVQEITAVSGDDALRFLKSGVPILAVLAGLNSGKRLLMIGGHGHGGVISAVNPKGNVEAKLTVVPMPPKPVKVALRQIQAIKDGKDFALLSETKFDPAAILVHMNAVWTPQTNIVFSLGRTDPVPIKEIAFASGGPSRTSANDAQALTNARDKSADLTIFFAKSVFDPPQDSHTPWMFAKNGYTDAENGFCAVADGRAEFTIEHEEGHFLGALNAKGKFEKPFGHSSGSNIMNVDIPSNGIIPLSMAKIFNKGFT